MSLGIRSRSRSRCRRRSWPEGYKQEGLASQRVCDTHGGNGPYVDGMAMATSGTPPILRGALGGGNKATAGLAAVRRALFGWRVALDGPTRALTGGETGP
jgi:hypothetical protein